IEKLPSRIKAIQECKANIIDFHSILVATHSSGLKKTILERKECILPQQMSISATTGFGPESYGVLIEIAEDSLPTTYFAF
ncbi:NAD(P)-dependent glycerol-3-phosphate dehydrogenase, partial [Francisella tularensis subsp. holarctica]|nr:NAD(P)-dependent glycerol-3-phosphate dehydrogenase [Francisella tularensis subsp. holarctica]